MVPLQSRLPSRYRLLEEVGQGGMAVVYRAQDDTLRREVAIKVLHAHLLAEPESKARLHREAQAVAKLQHDNIVQVFDFSGGDSPAAYIVTEFIDGQTLKQFSVKHKVPLPEIAALVAIEVSNALAHAHSVGIIHRDVKPENVMVRKDGILKLMDFGVAQIVDLERMTVTGQLLGSPAYMAPEILEGKQVDFRTDVFSVGIMLYQLATGVLPFSGKNPHEVLKRIAEGRFADPRISNRLISDRLSRIISRALARLPDARYATVAALRDDLKGYVADAGFENPHDELRVFFTDPDGYEKELKPRMVAALVATGKREQAGKNLARALESWNRALALDPDNADVLRALKRLEGSRRLQRGGIVVGGALLLAGLIWGAFQMARKDAPPALASESAGQKVQKPKAVPARKVPRPLVAAAPTPEKSAAGHPIESPSKARRQAATIAPTSAESSRPGHAEPGSAQMQTFSLGADPQSVEIFVDGISQGFYGPSKKTVDIPWDGRPHELVIKNDRCCNPWIRKVGRGITNPQEGFVARLERKIADLVVDLDPPQDGVQLMIEELAPEKRHPLRFPATSGDTVQIRFDASDEIKKSLRVTFALGDKTVTEDFFVNAGQRSRHIVQLNKPGK